MDWWEMGKITMGFAKQNLSSLSQKKTIFTQVRKLDMEPQSPGCPLRRDCVPLIPQTGTQHLPHKHT